MKKYHQYKTLKSAACAYLRSIYPGSVVTKISVTTKPEPEIGEIVQYGYRKKTTDQYVPNAYLRNFGWKNTYYQRAVNEVIVPIEWYLWFGWRE